MSCIMESSISRASILSRLGLICCVATLAGCGTFSGRSGSSADDSQASARSPADVASRRGGYYLDDGPGDRTPANLDAIPDAIPRLEPLHRGTSRPYTVMGRSYTPMTELNAYRERGVATWYGRRYHGQRTSSGEVYDMYGMTAAHTVLPIPSYARVTNLANGRSVVVRINDRGPFLAERLIDLSYVAAYKLGIVRNGSAPVEVETVLADGAQSNVVAAAPARSATTVALASADPGTQPTDASPLITAGDHYLQLAAFTVRDNAERFVERIRVQLTGAEAPLRIVAAGNVYRVHAGPYASRAAALQAAEGIEQILGTAPIVAGPR